MARNRLGVQKDGKTWRIKTNIVVDGKTIAIHRRGFKTQTDAVIAYEQIINDYRAHGYTDSFVRVFDALDDFIEFKSQTLKDRGYGLKKKLSKHLSMYETDLMKNIVQYNELLNFKDYLTSLDLTDDYINKIIRWYYQFLEYCYNRGIITNNDFKNVNLVITNIKSNQIKKEQPIWSKEQFTAFLEVIPKDSRDYVLYALWGQIGARIGEIRALQVRDFDLHNKSISIARQANSKMGINKTVFTTPKTRKANRTIPISENLTALIYDYIKTLGLKDEDLLFPSNRNGILSEHPIRKAIKKYAAAAGVPYINPHGIRHSNTTWLLTGSLTLDEVGAVSERLGHTNKSTTLNIYYHINKSESRNLVDLVDFNL